MSATPSWSDPALPPVTSTFVSEPPVSPVPSEPAQPAAPFAAPAPAPAPEPAPAVLPPYEAPAPAPPLEPAPAPLAPAAAALAPDDPDLSAGFVSEQRGATPLPVTTYRILVRVEGGEQLEVAAHADGAAARDEATTLMRYLRDGRGDWPFVAGRFIRPDRILSVDIEETRF